MKEMTLLSLLEDFFEPLKITYGNISYDYSDIDKNIVVFDNIYKKTRIDSEKNDNYLRSILCKDIYNIFCSPANDEGTTTTRRRLFVQGGHSAKSSSSPEPFIDVFLEDKEIALLEKQLARIESLIKTTAEINVNDYRDKGNNKYCLDNKFSADNQEVKKQIDKIKRELAKSFDENCKEIKDRLNVKKVHKEIVELYIACAIILILFDNKYYEGKKTKPYIDLLNNIILFEEKIRSWMEELIDAWRKDYIPFVTRTTFTKENYYISRKEIKPLVDHAFEGDGYHVYAIYGERGLGKTTLALRVAEELMHKKNFQVIYCTYNGSLKESIAAIERKRISDIHGLSTDERFDRNINDLETIKTISDVILIIDNYDNPNYCDELAFDCGEYIRLLETKVNILFTSTHKDLSECYALRGHVTELKPFSTAELKKLFYEISGHYNDKEDDIVDLIQNYLYYNTYLVVLCADLARDGMRVREIIDSFSSLHTDKTELFSSHTASDTYRSQTLMEHFCCVLDNNKSVNPAKAKEKWATHRILYILALLPIGGVDKDYFNIACGNDDKEDKRIIARLKDSHIIFENNNKIYMRPIVMEYVLRDLLMLDGRVLDFMNVLKQNLKADTMDAEIMNWVRMAESVTKTFKEEEIRRSAWTRTRDHILKLKALKIKYDKGILAEGKDLDYLNWLSEKYGESLLSKYDTDDYIQHVVDISCILDIRIAACWTDIDVFSEGYKLLLTMQEKTLGHTGVGGFKKLGERTLPAVDNVELARCAMVFAYTYLNVEEKSSEAMIAIAENYLNYGKSLLKDVNIYDDYRDMKAKIALTKLNGSLAGCHLQRKQYREALETHAAALQERRHLLEIVDESKKEQIARLTAFSLRAIGIVHYFIAEESTKTEEKAEHFLESYKNNLRSTILYQEYNLDAIGSINRTAGSALKLVEVLGNNGSLLQSKIGMNFDELVEKIYSYMKITFDAYETCGVDRNVEMKASLKRLITLTDMLVQSGKFKQDNIEFNRKAISIVYGLETTNEECYNLALKLQCLTNQSA